MARYKKIEIEMTPLLLKKVLEYVKENNTIQDIETVVANFIELSRADDLLTIEEFDLVTRKSSSM